MSIAPLASLDPVMSAGDTLLPAGWDSDWSTVSRDLTNMSTRELRVLCNQLYKSLDKDFPPSGAQEGYAVVVEELEQRECRAQQRQPDRAAPAGVAGVRRERFRDNPLASRFELFSDGTRIGYVRYDLRAGEIILLETVVTEPYEGRGLEPVLVRQALLNAHHRRLKTVPFCQHARAFLTANPQFAALIPAS
ncbi:GNAT family N-acetyltransferase [Arthrobacter sp. MDT1-65]